MTTMTIVGEQTGEDKYEVTATPDFGKRVKFRVGSNERSRAGYLVMNANGGMLTSHRTFERAVFEATRRAKRYVRAYSVPRTRTQ